MGTQLFDNFRQIAQNLLESPTITKNNFSTIIQIITA